MTSSISQLDLFSDFDHSKPVSASYHINVDNHFKSLKSATASLSGRYTWTVSSLIEDAGLRTLEGKFNLDQDAIQKYVDRGDIIVIKVGITYETWVSKYTKFTGKF